MGREPPSPPDQNGATAPRGDVDTFRPAAQGDGDAYSAETVVKAIPRELLADLASALKAPKVPKGAAPIADELTPIGDDDATVIDRFDPSHFEDLVPSSGRGAPPPDLTPIPPPPEPEPLPPSDKLLAERLLAERPLADRPLADRPLAIAQPEAQKPAPQGAAEVGLQAAPAPETSDIDENTDFRAGTRWPWITAIVIVVISFAVTLAALKAC